ncbi:hypothetical protein CSUB01_12663, partial [Colletotrichum sublineola]
MAFPSPISMLNYPENTGLVTLSPPCENIHSDFALDSFFGQEPPLPGNSQAAEQSSQDISTKTNWVVENSELDTTMFDTEFNNCMLSGYQEAAEGESSSPSARADMINND